MAMHGMAVSESSAERGADAPWFDQPEPDYQRRAKALSNRVDISQAAADYRRNGYLIPTALTTDMCPVARCD